MRVVVTGGAGRLGRVLVGEVLVFDRVRPASEEPGVRVRLSDDRDLG